MDEELKQQYIKMELMAIDISSVRSIREWIAKQADAPQILKDHETEAITKRKELK